MKESPFVHQCRKDAKCIYKNVSFEFPALALWISHSYQIGAANICMFSISKVMIEKVMFSGLHTFI